MSMLTIKNIITGCACGVVLIALQANAGVVLSTTRVVYEQSAHEKSLKAINRGKSPVLLQTWIDDGRETQSPDTINIPFMVTPPVGRLDPGREQTIKITSLGNNFPKNRESVFWLSVMEIPAKSKQSANANVLQVALRTRIKLFWRPDGLAGTPAEAAEKLQWGMTNENGKPALTVNNPSPYYVSLSKAEISSSGKTWTVDVKMLPPLSKDVFAINAMSNIPAAAEVKYIAIGDLGNILDNSQKIK